VAAGWRVAVNGIAEETERDLDDGRVIERTTVYTSGKTFVRQVVTATPIDRGVWREGAFRKGDGVSFGGSFFIAQRDTEPSRRRRRRRTTGASPSSAAAMGRTAS
jgi:hypothetical protein